MNSKNSIRHFAVRQTAAMFVFAMTAILAVAQDTATTTIRHGVSSLETEVRNAEVVYVEGNDLVLKLENGKVEHLVVPGNEKFVIDGNAATVKDLKAGTKLTQSITTTATPRYVNTVRTIKGKVWHVNVPASSLIVALPDGTHVSYKVPHDATFDILGRFGRHTTLTNLKKGMEFEATIVTDDAETVIARDKSNVGQTPAPQTPRLTSVLLIQSSPVLHVPAPASAMVASAEKPATMLPQTGSELPLTGLLGALASAASLGLGSVRRRFMAR